MKLFDIFYLFLLIFFVSCNTKQTKKEELKLTNISLQKIWETDTVLNTPESVIFDAERNVMFVSNVNKEPWKKTGDGFLSKLDKNGKIISLKWVEGMDSPKGMGIIGDTLYVADIDKVHKINISGSEIINTIYFNNENGLNDIDVHNGSVYITSSAGKTIYQLKGNSVSVVYRSDEGSFNGIKVLDDRILYLDAKKGALIKYGFETKTIDTVCTGLGYADGLEIVDGNMLTSDWKGELFFVDKNKKVTSLLKTKDLKINSADIGYIHKDSIVLVPTFWHNTIAAYKLKY